MESVFPGSRRAESSEPYRQGWFDGRYEEAGDFTGNVRLARWDVPEDRLEYYRGHRVGSLERVGAVRAA